MSIGPITQALIDCIEDDSLNSAKFFQIYPKTKALEKQLYELERKGYLVLDVGDPGILEIAETPSLLDLAKEVRQNHRQ